MSSLVTHILYTVRKQLPTKDQKIKMYSVLNAVEKKITHYITAALQMPSEWYKLDAPSSDFQQGCLVEAAALVP